MEMVTDVEADLVGQITVLLPVFLIEDQAVNYTGHPGGSHLDLFRKHLLHVSVFEKAIYLWRMSFARNMSLKCADFNTGKETLCQQPKWPFVTCNMPWLLSKSCYSEQRAFQKLGSWQCVDWSRKSCRAQSAESRRSVGVETEM